VVELTAITPLLRARTGEISQGNPPALAANVQWTRAMATLSIAAMSGIDPPTDDGAAATQPIDSDLGATDASAAFGADFRQLLALLHHHGVRYLIVGGFAVAVHGRPRFTPALDLWIDALSDNVDRLARALADFGFAGSELRADLVEPGVAIELGHAPHRIDLLTSLRGVDFAAAYPAHTPVRIGEVDVAVLDRASLIANKRALGRPRDLDDVSRMVLRPGWRGRTAAERIAEVEDMRRQWIDITGHPDAPMARVIRRRLDPAAHAGLH
jgi:hypothetical protein